MEPHGTTFHKVSAISAGLCSTLAHLSPRFPLAISELSGEDFQAESNRLKEGNSVIRSGLALSAGTVLPNPSPFVIASE